ncbi:hypothetical protein LCGC14_3127560 [marine sediment metagenome]|uniref:Uncharacterized protein n=1 Tax=marine sediment metagenome TaxID=412755 RepID=A0A0F8WPF1_9ZZZZ
MRDKLAWFVYLSLRRGVWGRRFVMLAWRISPRRVERLQARGYKLWVQKAFKEDE